MTIKHVWITHTEGNLVRATDVITKQGYSRIPGHWQGDQATAMLERHRERVLRNE